MRRSNLVVLLTATITILSSSGAMALPLPQRVSFQVHETPGDPTTPLQFTLSLSVTATDQKGESIAWQVTQAHFVEAGANGRDWSVSNPTIGTEDNLWWVEHSDANA